MVRTSEIKQKERRNGFTRRENKMKFQRILCLKLGFGRREHDAIPYRSMGPVTVDEYESRAERYDQQLKTEIGREPSGLTTEEKLQIVREYREDRYQKLIDAVYLRRGWTTRGVPKQDTLQRLGIDFTDVMALVSKHGG